jgi:hypothetical protein
MARSLGWPQMLHAVINPVANGERELTDMTQSLQKPRNLPRTPTFFRSMQAV